MMQLLNQMNNTFKACALLDNRDTFYEKKKKKKYLVIFSHIHVGGGAEFAWAGNGLSEAVPKRGD